MYVTQPGAMGSSIGHWTVGFCDCLSDIGTCAVGWCLPCVLYGQNVSDFRGGGCCGPCLTYCCCPCCACMLAGGTRGEIRRRYGLPEQPCSDCCVHLCCSSVALCQEAQEIKNQATMLAPMQQYMPPAAPGVQVGYGANAYPPQPYPPMKF